MNLDLSVRIRLAAARIDHRIHKWQGKPPYGHNVTKIVDKVLVAVSRVRLAIYVAWLALTGDTIFFQKWEARHINGADRYLQDHAQAKELWRYREAMAGEPGSVKEAIKQLGALRIKVKEQAKTIQTMQEVATLRNKQLEALHLVWCNGGCNGGVGDRENLTREKVLQAAVYVNRLVTWWNNRAYKDSGHNKNDHYVSARIDISNPS